MYLLTIQIEGIAEAALRKSTLEIEASLIFV
jgi:hypothetical protein